MRQVFFDAKGMKCPLPVLYARKKLKTIKSDEQLVILATDPNAPKDFINFCETTGASLVSCQEKPGGIFEIVLENTL